MKRKTACAVLGVDIAILGVDIANLRGQEIREGLQGGGGVDMAARCRRSSPRPSHGLPRCRHSKPEEARENGEAERGGATGGGRRGWLDV